jgi:exonuclease III
MRIVSWNMNRLGRSSEGHQNAWHYLRNELGVDVALVQEAVPPDDLTEVEYRPIGDAPYDWGSAVVALRPGLTLGRYTRIPLAESLFRGLGAGELPDSHPGACAVADISLDGAYLFTAVSVYAQWEMLPGSSSMYGSPRLHRMLSDLTGVLAPSRRRPLLLAGDFNITSQGSRLPENEAAAVFARLKAWGLASCPLSAEPLDGCDCPEGDGCRHIRTFRTGTQLDYAFASPSIRLSSRAEHSSSAWQLSDHCPLVLDTEEP